MGTNRTSVTADVFLFCYERGFMFNLRTKTRNSIIDAFDNILRYLNYLFKNDDPYLRYFIKDVYPPELEDKTASF